MLQLKKVEYKKIEKGVEKNGQPDYSWICCPGEILEFQVQFRNQVFYLKIKWQESNPKLLKLQVLKVFSLSIYIYI